MQQTIVDLGELDWPVLVFGGAYGNLQATAAMRETAEALGLSPAQVICNGDTVAYCAQPAETIALLRDWDPLIMQGNCETSLAAGSSDCGCGFASGSSCSVLSENWYRYCQREISGSAKVWMGSLPGGFEFTLSGLKFRMVHGAVSSINRFLYASSVDEEKQQELALTDANVVIGGHAGIPFGQKIDSHRYWLNSGVIGMPANDGSKDGWYLLLNPTGDRVRSEWRRLKYNAAAAREAMYQAGLRNGYAEALMTGLWPSMDTLPERERTAQGKKIAAWAMDL